MSARFAERRFLVCGAATGIGAETARLLAAEGAEVLIQYRSRAKDAQALCEELVAHGSRASVYRADMVYEDDVRMLTKAVGTVHGFVHSISGAVPKETFEKTPWTEYQAHWESSVKSAFLLVRSLLESEVRPSVGVFVLSTYTIGVPPKNMAAYTTAKYALLGLMKSMAAEQAPNGLRLNGVSPGFTETPFTEHVEPRHRELLARGLPMKRFGTPREAAAAIAFLLSDESEYMTGTNLIVGGGAVM
jgi:3-oxoacyl-[acyl-carrier protein] reductase